MLCNLLYFLWFDIAYHRGVMVGIERKMDSRNENEDTICIKEQSNKENFVKAMTFRTDKLREYET